MAEQSYLDLFIEEAREHIQSLNQSMMALEQAERDSNVVSEIFRSAHTLKGMAATMGFEQMTYLTHEMENGLDKVRHGQLAITPKVMDVLFRCVDLLETQLEAIVSSGSDKDVVVHATLQELISVIAGTDQTQFALGGTPRESSMLDYTESVLAEARQTGKTVYLVEVVLEPSCVMRGVRAYMVVRSLEHLGDVVKSEPSANDLEDGKFEASFHLLLVSDVRASEIQKNALDVSEVLSVMVQEIDAVPQRQEEQASQRVEEKQEGTSHPSKPSRSQARSIRVDVDRLDALMNLFSEFVIDKTRLEMISRQSTDSILGETVQHLSRVGTDLQGIVMKIRMVAIESVFNRFPRMVRDLAKTLGKQVDFTIFGEETELDRTIIEDIGDPLVHILRNSVDHGLEMPEERRKAGKNEAGKVRMAAYQAGNHVFIEIEDDGRGIDPKRILQKAIQQGLIQTSQANGLTDSQIFKFLFESGFSTAETVTDISGRGVGLDAAKSKILGLGGDLMVESEMGRGTKFTVQLPLTLSIMDAMLVQVGAETFAIPLNSIVKIERVNKSAILHVQGKPVMEYEDRVVPLLYTRERFSISGAKVDRAAEYVVVMKKGDKLVALVIDRVVGRQEIVLKSLGKYLEGSVSGISGATILGDGQVSMIVDPNALFG